MKHGWQTAGQEQAVHHGSNEGWQHPKLCEQDTARRWREGIVPLCSAPVRPHLDTLSSFGPPVQEIYGQTKAVLAEAIDAVGAGALALCSSGLVSLEMGPLGEKGALGGPTLAPQYLGETFEKIELGSAQWCM